MSKTNKELAIDVAIAALQANPKMINGNVVTPGIDLKGIINIIESVNQTLEKIDSNRE